MSQPSRPAATLVRFRSALRDSPPLLWSFLYFFCLLSAYYVLRPVREAMGASSDVQAIFPPWMIEAFTRRGVALGEFTLQVLFTCTFLIMLLLQPLYGLVVSRYPRRVFLPAVYGFFLATLLFFYFIFDSGVPGRGMAFFLWITVFNLFAVAVFWSFMADVFDDVEARAYYGYIGAAGTLGALFGPLLTRTFVERIGIANLMLVSAVLLSAALVCVLRLRHWAVLREQARRRVSGEIPIGGGVFAGLRLVATEPLLRWIAILVLLGIGVGTMLYNEQAAIMRAAYPDDRERSAIYGDIDLAVNGVALVIQLFFTRFLMSRFGIGPVLMITSLAVLVGFSILAASPLPLLVTVVQVMTRAGEFSLGKPARETIYTRVGREWRYKAGAAIDTVIYRGGDLTFVWVHKLLAGFGSNVVFGAGLLIATGMAFGAWRVLREQARLPDERGAAATPGAT
jgi:ATP:ADP antiporter, AAA family